MRVSLINVHVIESDAIGQCLLTQARALQERGHAVRIFVQFVPPNPSNLALALGKVVDAEALRADEFFRRADLCVFHYPGLYGLLDAMQDLPREKVLLYFHNVTPPDIWGFEHERDLLERSRAAIPDLVRRSGLVVTPSPFNSDELVADYGSPPQRIRVLPMAVDSGRFHPGPVDADLLRRYKPAGRKLVLFVGRMAGNKRIDVLVEALPLVRQQVPDTTLMLVGDDVSNPTFVEVVSRVRARASALGVADNVVITGKVDDLASYYRLSDVYASASLHEGFGVPIIEAMATGVPVVASRATAHPWVVGDAGLLAEPADPVSMAAQIVRVLTDDGLRRQLTAKGLARSRELSLSEYGRRWAELVNAVRSK